MIAASNIHRWIKALKTKVKRQVKFKIQFKTQGEFQSQLIKRIRKTKRKTKVISFTLLVKVKKLKVSLNRQINHCMINLETSKIVISNKPQRAAVTNKNMNGLITKTDIA